MKPYKKGYLKVTENHLLYFECIGNQDAQPILFVHGGPALGCSKADRKFFDFERDNVIFLDQRGAPKSKVIGDDVLVDNNTDNLVSDINKLIDYLEIDKIVLFGGSWGTTLSLVYAIRNPDRVAAMILRGVFLSGTKPEEDFLFGNGNENFFPDLWDDTMKYFPKELGEDRKKIVDYMWSEHEAGNIKPLMAICSFEFRMVGLDPKEWEDWTVDNFGKAEYKQALIEFHYHRNSCFIEKDYILDNSEKIENIPTTIVHGRYDSICPAIGAYKLHKKLKKSKLKLTVAGHYSRDKENKKALKKAVKDLKNIL